MTGLAGDLAYAARTLRSVSPGYLEALGRRLIAGRFLEARDSAAARTAVVVNRTFADRYLDEPVVGSLIGNFGDVPDQEVVGVVEEQALRDG